MMPMINKQIILLSALCLLTSDLILADYTVIDVPHGGTIHGFVKFRGESPPRGMFGTRGDAQCPAGVPQDNLFVKQENRGIRNVLIVLDTNKGKPLPTSPVRLDLKGCRYLPRLQWAPKSSSLLINNLDHTVHSVQALRNDNKAFDVDIQPGKSVRRPLLEEGFYKFNDDHHLWMRGWVYVSDDPYVTVTDAEGRFELSDIPPGTYNLRAWHEGWKDAGTEKTGQPMYLPVQQVLRVKVRAEKDTEAVFDDLEPGPGI
jgi:hypothetical protein